MSCAKRVVAAVDSKQEAGRAGSTKQGAGGSEQEIGSRKQEAGSREHEAGRRKHEAGNRKQEGGCEMSRAGWLTWGLQGIAEPICVNGKALRYWGTVLLCCCAAVVYCAEIY